MISPSRRVLSAALFAPVLLAAAQPPGAAPPVIAAPAPPAITPLPVAPVAMPSFSAEQTSQLQAMLDGAAANGIAPSDGSSAAPDRPSGTALIQAALDYARAIHHGRLAESDFIGNWGLRPPAYDPTGDFVAAVKADRLSAWIASLPPPWAGYGALRKALATYRGIERAGGWPTLEDGPDLASGAAGDRVAALRARLAIEDDGIAKGKSYDDDTVAAVQRAQRRYGLQPTGILGKATIAALNVGAHDRVRQIEANMERWRWLPAVLPTHRVQVNIAAAVLTVFDADKPVMSMRVVTGRPGDETPMLSSMIHSIVFNPPWNVPSSIATKELWPKEKAHPGYLKSHAFRVIGTGAGARLQQQAGSKSALGRVKFDFDNSYGVYLHDTPSQGTFDRYSRLASHGCVRLAHPVDLAKLMLQDDATWTPDAIDAAIQKGDTVRAHLPDPVAVYLLYWTAYASADGKATFLADPYGWDGQLADRLTSSANRARQTMAIQ